MGLFKKKAGGDPDALIEGFEVASFPGPTLALLRALREPDTTNEELGERLAADPGLSLRVLRIVNSSTFGLRHRVDDLGHAVQALGRSALESQVISGAVHEALPGGPTPDFDPARFWRGSARRAVLARALDGQRGASPWLFTAALLQDMAVPMLANGIPREYGPVLQAWQRNEGTLHELERQAFGWDHAEIAARMCEHWDLPDDLGAAVGGHHGADGNSEVPAALRLSAVLRDGDDEDEREELLAAAEAAGRNRDEVEQIFEAMGPDVEELAALLSG